MSDRKYSHVAVNNARNGYQHNFSRGYEAQFQNHIQTSRPAVSPGPLRTAQLRWWCWELVAASYSIALFIAVIVVLKVYDGKPLPEFSFGITLNTTISLIATLSKTALLLVASAAMSQFKWLWIHQRPRKLQDLQAFDEASRGPWGAFTLLQHSRLSVASIGALIMLLLLGFDPFIQQLITTPERYISYDAGVTAVNKASAFDQYSELASYLQVNNTMARLSGVNPFPIIQTTVSTGISSQGQLVNFSPSCPTSNCTWPTFKSLGMCSTCRNVTDYARKNWMCEDEPPQTVAGVSGNNRTCNYNLPNSAFTYQYLVFGNGTDDLEVGGELRLNTWTTLKQQTTFSSNTFMLVSSMRFENAANLIPGIGREQVREATECALAMCVEEHELSVALGIVNHTIANTEQPFDMILNSAASSRVPTYDVQSAEISGVTYSVDGLLTLQSVMIDINTTLIGNITVDYTVTTSPDSPVQYDGGVDSSSILATSIYAGLNFTQAVENLATSVSQYIRSLSDAKTIGQAHSVEVFVHVKWDWLVFPVILVASGIAMLIVAILQTSSSGLEVWKSSSLPLWFHGPQNGRTNSFGGSSRRVNTLVEMETEAAQIEVTLGKLDDGSGAWKLLPAQHDAKFGFI